MIGSLRGKLLRLDGMTALIECAGVGYEVELPARTLRDCKIGEELMVYVHHVLREDASLLFGFATLEERSLFRELIKVSGVGAKTALAALSTYDAQSFLEVVRGEQVSLLQRIPGVGRKTAERMVVDLKDRLGKFAAGTATELPVAAAAADEGADLATIADAVAALVGLGYKEAQSSELIRKVARPGLSTQDLIVAALNATAKRK